MGQISFLYFLQKKGWFGVAPGKEWGSGVKNFLREVFNRHEKYGKNLSLIVDRSLQGHPMLLSF